MNTVSPPVVGCESKKNVVSPGGWSSYETSEWKSVVVMLLSHSKRGRKEGERSYPLASLVHCQRWRHSLYHTRGEQHWLHDNTWVPDCGQVNNEWDEKGRVQTMLRKCSCPAVSHSWRRTLSPSTDTFLVTKKAPVVEVVFLGSNLFCVYR